MITEQQQLFTREHWSQAMNFWHSAMHGMEMLDMPVMLLSTRAAEGHLGQHYTLAMRTAH